MAQGQIGSTETPNNGAASRRTRKSPAPRRVTNFDLGRMGKQLRTILGREILSLMDASYRKRLHPKAADTLIKYTRLVKELQKLEEEEMKKMSGAELAKLVGKGRTPKSQSDKNDERDQPTQPVNKRGETSPGDSDAT